MLLSFCWCAHLCGRVEIEGKSQEEKKDNNERENDTAMTSTGVSTSTELVKTNSFKSSSDSIVLGDGEDESSTEESINSTKKLAVEEIELEDRAAVIRTVVSEVNAKKDNEIKAVDNDIKEGTFEDLTVEELKERGILDTIIMHGILLKKPFSTNVSAWFGGKEHRYFILTLEKLIYFHPRYASNLEERITCLKKTALKNEVGASQKKYLSNHIRTKNTVKLQSESRSYEKGVKIKEYFGFQCQGEIYINDKMTINNDENLSKNQLILEDRSNNQKVISYQMETLHPTEHKAWSKSFHTTIKYNKLIQQVEKKEKKKNARTKKDND